MSVFQQRQEMGDGKVTLSSLASAVSSGKLSGLDLHQLNVILKVDLQVCSQLLVFAGDIVLMILYIFDH
jgi:hypothetical protein